VLWVFFRVGSVLERRRHARSRARPDQADHIVCEHEPHRRYVHIFNGVVHAD
jgi:hypothetical protein